MVNLPLEDQYIARCNTLQDTINLINIANTGTPYRTPEYYAASHAFNNVWFNLEVNRIGEFEAESKRELYFILTDTTYQDIEELVIDTFLIANYDENLALQIIKNNFEGWKQQKLTEYKKTQL